MSIFSRYSKQLLLIVPATTIIGFSFGIQTVNMDAPIRNKLLHTFEYTGFGMFVGFTYPISIPYLCTKTFIKYNSSLKKRE